MPQNVAFYQGLHCLLRRNQSLGKEILRVYFLEIITYEPSIYTLHHPDLTVSNFMGNSISLQSFKEFDANAISTKVSCAGMSIYSPLQHLMVNRTKSQKLPGLMAAHQKSKFS